MVHLKESNPSNVLYSLAKGLGTLRCDESDTRFPTKEYCWVFLSTVGTVFLAHALIAKTIRNHAHKFEKRLKGR